MIVTQLACATPVCMHCTTQGSTPPKVGYAIALVVVAVPVPDWVLAVPVPVNDPVPVLEVDLPVDERVSVELTVVVGAMSVGGTALCAKAKRITCGKRTKRVEETRILFEMMMMIKK